MKATSELSPFKNIVVATDFHECSARAVEMAAQLAKASDALLTVVHTVEPPTYAYAGMEFSTIDWLTPLHRAAEEMLNHCVQGLLARSIRVHGALGTGGAWEHILSVAKECHADLIVVGTHGRRGFSHALLGSVAEKVVRMSPIPVLTFRSEAKAE